MKIIIWIVIILVIIWLAFSLFGGKDEAAPIEQPLTETVDNGAAAASAVDAGASVTGDAVAQ